MAARLPELRRMGVEIVRVHSPATVAARASRRIPNLAWNQRTSSSRARRKIPRRTCATSGSGSSSGAVDVSGECDRNVRRIW